MKIDQNKFWKEINENQLSLERIESEFQNFKSSPVNHKIALFNPEVNGVRYLKTVNFLLASMLSERERQLIENTRNREVGNPFSIQYEGLSVCLDYLQATQEAHFIEKSCALDGSRIVEIGAGYGRTGHTLLSNFDIERYTIVDLPNALQLSSKYLGTVLDAATYEKLTFISVADFSPANLGQFDLAINIDSFAEMDKEVVEEYLSFIDAHCSAFYVKNPVGKYLDKTLDGHSQGQEVIELALRQGLLTDIIDIDDQAAVIEASTQFLPAYTPSENWSSRANAWAPPFSYIWQALYLKDSRD